MATTSEDQKKAAVDFAAGYEEDQSKNMDAGDDEAFGLVPDEVPGASTPTGNAPSITITPAAAQASSAAESAAKPADASAAAPALDVEKETQRLKSWEGRLRAQAAEMAAKAKEQPAAAIGDKAALPGDNDFNDDADEDMKALMEDFGPEFTTLLGNIIKKLAKKYAKEAATEHTAPYRKDIDDVIAEIANEKQRAHYEKIVDAHPDFMDIANSDEFKSWIAHLEPGKKDDVERVAAEGNAKEIIAMLKQYKATLAAPASDAGNDADNGMADALSAAEGVRSSGLKLPAKPGSKNDYETAWNSN